MAIAYERGYFEDARGQNRAALSVPPEHKPRGRYSHQQDGASLRSALAHAGITQATTLEDTARLLDRDSITYLRLECFAPRGLDLLRLREVFGLRSCGNTVCRVLNPARAPAAVQGVFHSPYRPLQQATEVILGQKGLSILKGGGEFERNPTKDVTLFRLQDSTPLETVLPPLLPEARKLAHANYTSDALQALWRGMLQDEFAQLIVTGTAAAALIALGRTPKDAATQASALWAARQNHPQAAARNRTP